VMWFTRHGDSGLGSASQGIVGAAKPTVPTVGGPSACMQGLTG